jgi:hypothetical protein
MDSLMLSTNGTISLDVALADYTFGLQNVGDQFPRSDRHGGEEDVINFVDAHLPLDYLGCGRSRRKGEI